MRREKNDALPKISIIIPSYNKVKYIDQTLKSIFEQKYKNLEVIINDGGSTDGTVSIIKEYGPFTGTKDFIMEYDLWLKLCRISVPTVINKNISKFRIDDNTKTKTMYMQLLKEDWKVVKKYTHNPLVLALHLLNNFGRELVGIFV